MHLGQHRLGASVGQRALLLQRGDFRFRIRPHCAVGAGFGEWSARDDLRRLVDDEVIREARRTNAGGGILFRRLDQLAQRAAGLANAIDVAVHVRWVVDPVEGDQQLRKERVDRRHLVEDVGVGAEARRGLSLLELVEPDVVRGLRFRSQPGVVERRAHLGGGGSLPGQHLVLRSHGHVVEVARLLTEERLLNRAERELFLEFFLEPGIDARGFVPRRLRWPRRRGRLSVGSRHRQDGQGRDDAREQQSGHG